MSFQTPTKLTSLALLLLSITGLQWKSVTEDFIYKYETINWQ